MTFENQWNKRNINFEGELKSAKEIDESSNRELDYMEEKERKEKEYFDSLKK